MSVDAVLMPQILRFKADGLQVGDRVTFRMVATDVVGTVIEDRGPIGVRGRRILRLRLDPKYEVFGHEFEMPAEELRPA
ncbi:MAG: hypothetical protein GY856_48610 [bacterium]|nr:hypothetical protein [bacterium]